MRKVLLVSVFLFSGCIAHAFNSNISYAQEYVKDGDKFTVITNKIVEQQTYSTTDIENSITVIKTELVNKLIDLQKQMNEAQNKADSDIKSYEDILANAVSAGVLDKKSANDVLRRANGQVEGVNWSTKDMF